MSMFHGTELEWHLRGLGIQTCVMVGVSTSIALPGSANEAVARLLNTVIPEDCTAGGTTDSHEMQIRLHLPLLATVTSSEAVITALHSLKGESA